MNKSESIAQLAEALSKAQGKMKNAVKDSANSYFKSNYADLASVVDACRESLSVNGLSVCQLPTMRDGKMVLEYMLLHSSGEYIASELEMTPLKLDPQGIGSAVTYARRYTLAAIAGVATEDDDGNAASGNKAGAKETPAVSFKKPTPENALADALVKKANAKLVDVAAIPIDGEGCITQIQAKELHIAFGKALKLEHRKSKDDFLRDWLRQQGLVNVLGEPSTLAIRQENFAIVKRAACEFAEGL